MSCLALAVGDDCLQVPAVRKMAAPVVRREVTTAELTAERRAKRDERWMFCFLVFDLAKKGYTAPDAAAVIAATECHRFPSLLAGGKGGKCQLTYNNYRNWTGLLGKKGKEINWDNRDALADRYATGPMEAKIDPDWLKLFNALYLNRVGLDIIDAMRQASKTMREINPFLPSPSYRQVRYYVQRLDPAAVALARLGEEWVKGNMLSYINRDWTDVKVNEVWVTDHRVFDCPVKAWDEAKGKWVAKRPWLCGFMDGKSWYMVSWMITVDSPNNETIRQALALGIVANGGRAPEIVYSDNGADFLKQGFTTPVQFGDYETSILKELNVEAKTAIAYNARAKTIERDFRNIAKRFDKYFAGYLGNRPGARPEIAGFYWHNPELLPTLQEFCSLFAEWMEQFHREPNNGKILGGKSPLEVWARGEAVVRPALSEAELFTSFLLPLPESRTVHRGPAVSVDKVEYYGDCLWPWMGKGVMVKTDRLDTSHVFVFELNGRPIGECRTRAAVKALARTPEERALLSEQMAGTRRQLKRAYTMLEALTEGRHVLSAYQQGDGEIVTIGKRNSVKGATHLVCHHELKGRLPELIGYAEEASTNGANLDFGREEKKAKKLDEFGKKVTEAAAGAAGQEPGVPAESLSEFHMFMTGKRGDEDEY